VQHGQFKLNDVNLWSYQSTQFTVNLSCRSKTVDALLNPDAMICWPDQILIRNEEHNSAIERDLLFPNRIYSVERNLRTSAFSCPPPGVNDAQCCLPLSLPVATLRTTRSKSLWSIPKEYVVARNRALLGRWYVRKWRPETWRAK
jgi:hypothetical protein